LVPRATEALAATFNIESCQHGGARLTKARGQVMIGWTLDERLRSFENRCAYFAGFGAPLTAATFALPFFPATAVYASCFPLLILLAAAAAPKATPTPPRPPQAPRLSSRPALPRPGRRSGR
jgi:hypothetical protein